MMRLIVGSMLAISLCGCAELSLQRPSPVNAVSSQMLLNTSDALDVLISISALGPDAQHQELLKPKTGKFQNPVSLFRFAVLLGRDPDPSLQDKGLKILDGLNGADARAQAVIDLTKTSLVAQIEARRQGQRAQELQDRIDQIKALEKSLQQRDTKPGTR